MNTQSLRQFIFAPDSTGMNITALCFCAFGGISFLATMLICILRLWGGYYSVAAVYLVMSVLSALMTVYTIKCINSGKVQSLKKIAYPLTAGMFVYGLTILFFMDGGRFGGVPLFFILAVVATPCFLEITEAVIMVCLEVLVYVSNVILAELYTESVNSAIAVPTNSFLPLVMVAITLAGLCIIYTYAYRHQQTRLDAAISEAKSANEAKSSFLENMSHEIRTPMNSILGMNEMILREEDRPEIKEYALVVQRSGRALLGIINDILDFSKLQDRKMEIVPVRYDLSSLINDLVNIAAEQAKKKSLNFTVNVDKEIPRILDGDEYHIRQVMLNLLNNAIKYTERGGITVTIGFEKTGSYTIMMKFSVTDTGIGIRSEDMENIFRPFEHVETARKFSADGSGLGLPIVQKLLQLMDSELRIESVFHKGSTFSFDIVQNVIKWEPIGDYERAFMTASSRQAKKYTQSFQAPNARVLVVDDADVNLLVFANLLKKTKIQIDTASSGVEMLQMVRMNHYNIIFLDHRMPGMDGIEAFHNMKKMTDGLNFNTPVVALTANAVLGARQLYIDEGFSDYISKPVDTVRLEQVLLEYLPPDLIIKGSDMQEEETASRDDLTPSPSTYAGDGNTGFSSPMLGEAGRGSSSMLGEAGRGSSSPYAGEENSNEAPEESDSPYRNIPGIDYDAAVTNCGTEDTFVQALEIFYNTLDKKAGDIERFASEGDIKNYTVLVHALKSSARLVGALHLSEDAKYLEACGDKNDVAEIEAKTPALLSQYRGYKPVLAEVFGKNDEPDMSLPEISLEDLHEMYSLIKGFAADFDLDNIDNMIAEAKNYRIPESERERFEKIKDCVTAADWGTLEQLLP